MCVAGKLNTVQSKTHFDLAALMLTPATSPVCCPLHKSVNHGLFKSLLTSNTRFLNTQEFVSSFLEMSASTLSAGLFGR